MNIHLKTSIWEDAAFYEGLAARWRRSRAPGSAKYIFATVAIIGPMLLVFQGIGMSRQGGDVTLNDALASLFAITFSFFVIRRLVKWAQSFLRSPTRNSSVALIFCWL
jgi:hypothetical protein